MKIRLIKGAYDASKYDIFPDLDEGEIKNNVIIILSEDEITYFIDFLKFIEGADHRLDIYATDRAERLLNSLKNLREEARDYYYKTTYYSNSPDEIN